MSSMFKLQLAYDEAKTALEQREKALLKSKTPVKEPLKNLSQITSLLQTYLLDT